MKTCGLFGLLATLLAYGFSANASADDGKAPAALEAARNALLADFDRVAGRLEKERAQGKKLPVAPDVVNDEKARFQKDGLVPWSEPMRPFLDRYLKAAQAAGEKAVIAVWKHQPGTGA